MKALTVCQPYAQLLLTPEKPIENRTWYTNYRGPLVIHAGKSRDWLDEWYPDLVFGAIVGIVDLVACVRVERLPAHLQANEHANGPWCLIRERPRRVKPVPYRGAQGLWELPEQVFLNLMPLCRECERETVGFDEDGPLCIDCAVVVAARAGK